MLSGERQRPCFSPSGSVLRNECPAIGSMWQANAFSVQNVLDLRMAYALMLVVPLIYKYWCEPGWEAEPARPRFLLSRGFAVR